MMPFVGSKTAKFKDGRRYGEAHEIVEKAIAFLEKMKDAELEVQDQAIYEMKKRFTAPISAAVKQPDIKRLIEFMNYWNDHMMARYWESKHLRDQVIGLKPRKNTQNQSPVNPPPTTTHPVPKQHPRTR